MEVGLRRFRYDGILDKEGGKKARKLTMTLVTTKCSNMVHDAFLSAMLRLYFHRIVIAETDLEIL